MALPSRSVGVARRGLASLLVARRGLVAMGRIPFCRACRETRLVRYGRGRLIVFKGDLTPWQSRAWVCRSQRRGAPAVPCKHVFPRAIPVLIRSSRESGDLDTKKHWIPACAE